MSVEEECNLDGEEEKHPESGRVVIWMARCTVNLEGEKRKAVT